MAMVNAFKQIQVSQAQGQKIGEGLSIKEKELLVFTKSFRDLYEAGLPINQNLRHLQQTTPNEKFALALGLIINDLENGKLLSEAMARFPGVFGEDYRSMIRAAEKSGNWTRRRNYHDEIQNGILDLLIRYIKRRNSARERIKSEMLYPSIIIFAIVVALSIFAFYILPSLQLFFSQTGSSASVGTLTGMLITVGSVLERYWWAIPFIVLGCALAAWHFWKYGNGRALWMKYQLRLRFIGPIFVKVNLGHLLWMMGTLFSAGLTPQEVLDIVIESTSNSEISGALAKAKEHFYNGISFCDSLKRSHSIFDGQTYMVIATSQKNGSMDTALQNYAEEQFEDMDQNIDRLVKLIEPALIIVAGIVVGLIAIAYYSGIGSAVSNLAK